MQNNTTIFLDEQYRVPGLDHLDQYRNSCFYNLLDKSTKERGNAFEEICAKALRAVGHDVVVPPATYGAYDLIVDGERVELKSSRKASQYDTRGRSYQFSNIRYSDTGALMLMIIQPDDTVKIYKTTFTELFPHFNVMVRDRDGKATLWQLSKHPEEAGCELFAEVSVR